MGKKRSRKTKTSKGIHTAVAKVRVERSALDKELIKLAAWRKGQNPWLTVENINGPADRKFIKVRANSYWGDPRKKYNVFLKKEKNERRPQN